LIVHKTFEIIFTDFMKEDNDVWFLRRQASATLYDKALTSRKFALDADDNNLITAGDPPSESGQVTMVR